MLNSLIRHGLPCTLVSLVGSWATRRTSALWDGVQRRLTSGLPQSSPLSPILFTLFITPVMSVGSCRKFNFANDLGVLAHGESLTKVEKALESNFSKLEEWGQSVKASFDNSKSELILFPPKKGQDHTLSGGSPSTKALPPPKKSIKWLGIVLDQSLTFQEHVKTRCSHTEKLVGFLKRLRNPASSLPLRAGAMAVKACVVPSLLYRSEL